MRDTTQSYPQNALSVAGPASGDCSSPSLEMIVDVEHSMEIANGFLGFFCLFNGGNHAYYKEYTSFFDTFKKMVG